MVFVLNVNQYAKKHGHTFTQKYTQLHYLSESTDPAGQILLITSESCKDSFYLSKSTEVLAFKSA